MKTAVIQLAGEGLRLEATDAHPAGLLYSGGYDSKRGVLYAASVMGHPRGVSLAGGDPDDEFVSGLRVMIVESGDVYWATDSMSLPRGLTEEEAKEVVQETLIAASKNLPEFRYDRRICSFKTWLLNLSDWRVKDQLRKRQAPASPKPTGRERGEQDDGTRTATIERVADPAGDQLEAIWDREWKMTIWEAALGRVKVQLDLKQWQMFDLYVLKEWPVREVAKALGVSVGRVYLAKHRVSSLVKREVKKIGQSG